MLIKIIGIPLFIIMVFFISWLLIGRSRAETIRARRRLQLCGYDHLSDVCKEICLEEQPDKSKLPCFFSLLVQGATLYIYKWERTATGGSLEMLHSKITVDIVQRTMVIENEFIGELASKPQPLDGLLPYVRKIIGNYPAYKYKVPVANAA